MPVISTLTPIQILRTLRRDGLRLYADLKADPPVIKLRKASAPLRTEAHTHLIEAHRFAVLYRLVWEANAIALGTGTPCPKCGGVDYASGLLVGPALWLAQERAKGKTDAELLHKCCLTCNPRLERQADTVAAYWTAQEKEA